MKKRLLIYALALTLGLASCRSYHETTLLAINDVYEIAPLSEGKVGGIARVATVRRQLQERNQHTYLMLAGDFVSPSALGTLRFEGNRLAGRQMVDALNTAGVDYVTFGNHEFDISLADLQARINESEFAWIAGNVRRKDGEQIMPFYKERGGKREELPNSVIIQTPFMKIGVISVCLPVDKEYAFFDNIYETARREYDKLAPQTDFVIAMTHLELGMDQELARQIPGLKLIMGGHEHENMKHQVGQTIICKADANAKTAYVHRLQFNPKTKEVRLRSTLKKLDMSVQPDPATAQVVKKWMDIAWKSFGEQGFDPQQIVATTSVPWDGLEASVRNQSTNLTELIGKAMLATCPECDAAVYNSGSIRIDDQLVGNISQYDIVRILPFGGALAQVRLEGAMLLRLLEAGRANKGIGGYLQYAGIAPGQSAGEWLLKGSSIRPEQTYTIITSDFLVSGKEFNMGFFKEGEPGILQVSMPDAASQPLRTDIRKALIEYLRQNTR